MLVGMHHTEASGITLRTRENCKKFSFSVIDQNATSLQSAKILKHTLLTSAMYLRRVDS